MKESVLHPNPMCFVCGTENPIGLGLKITVKNNRAQAAFITANEHQGPKGLIHGGLISALLDEVMVNILWSQGKQVVTAELKTRMIKPVKPGQTVHISAQQLRERHGLIEVEADMQFADGTIAAKGMGKFMPLKNFKNV